MRKFGGILYLAVILLFFASCAGAEDALLTEHATAQQIQPAAHTAPFPEDDYTEAYADALPASAGFARFMSDVSGLGGNEGIEYFTDHEVINIKDEHFIIDIVFPVTESYILNTAVQQLVYERIDAFTSANNEGHLFARTGVFQYKTRFFGLALDFRSYGDNAGFAAARYSINFDLEQENFIQLEDMFSSNSDFTEVLTELSGPNLNGFKLTGHEAFNFDDQNIYLHINAVSLNYGDYGYFTLEIPLEEIQQIWRGESFDQIEGNGRLVALTFDDGPNNTLTVAILDALKERNVRATFFLLGSQVVRHPEVVVRMYEEGHLIGNHSTNHPTLTRLSRQRIFDELEETSSAIEAITGSRPSVLRPPYGISNAVVQEIARELEMSVILWSVDPRDWRYRDAVTVREHVLNHVNDGSVVLLHDIWQSSVDATIMIIDILLERGYTLVTVEELFERNAMVLEAGEVYHSPYRSAGR